MNIQIYGSKKCFDTKKGERFFKERKVKYQYIDMLKYGLSKRELASVIAAVGVENLVNPRVAKCKALNLHRVSTDNSSWSDILLNNPDLLITPIVRNGKLATAGYMPQVWRTWE